LLSELLLTKKT